MPLIEPGERAPNFDLPNRAGTRVTLAGLRGRPVVLFFYPKDGTKTCTEEACAFRDARDEMESLGARAIGVSPDDSRSHALFDDAHALGLTLLADVDHATCEAYGVWAEKSMYGRRYMGVLRTTYLIDGEGVVARRWDAVRVRGHVEAVLAALRELAGGRPAGDAPEQRPRSSRPRAAQRPRKARSGRGPGKE
jgi:peroxiredoxin Q/BCP